MAEVTGAGAELDRRTVLRRAAMAGLLATPAAGLLGACASGGDDGSTADKPSGEKSATNPLGVDPKAPLEIMIFNGGLGTKYATDIDIPSYNRLFPESKVTFGQTEQIATVVQPRINAGSPPDMINNSGSNLMDLGALVQAGQAQDLTELLDAPSLDIAGKKVRDTLVPGAVEEGTLAGKPYAINYGFTIFGLWYNAKLFAENNWAPPATWAEFTALLDQIKAKGITPYGYAGSNAAYYQYRAILTSAAKIGGLDVLKAIDNLQPDAWRNEAVLQAAEAWGAIGQKYADKAQLGLKHTEVQLQQNQNKVAIYPSGSWLENEQAKDTPASYEYAVMPIPSVTTADKLPATAINAQAGEVYFVAARGKNTRGGMEFLRHMLSNDAAKKFTELTKTLTIVQGATQGLTLSPGLASATAMLEKAGTDIVSYRWEGWYKKLDDECRSATNQLMFAGGNAQAFCDRMQKAADTLKADASVQKFTRD